MRDQRKPDVHSQVTRWPRRIMQTSIRLSHFLALHPRHKTPQPGVTSITPTATPALVTHVHSSAKTSIIHRRATLPRPAVSKHRTSDVQQPQRDYSVLAQLAAKAASPIVLSKAEIRASWDRAFRRAARSGGTSILGEQRAAQASVRNRSYMGRGVSERSTQMNSNLEVHAMLHVPEELRRLIGETCELLNRLDRLPSVVASEHVTAAAEHEQAVATRDAVQADALLAPSDPDIANRAEIAQTRAQEIDAKLARLANAKCSLPRLLAELDERVVAASATLREASAPLKTTVQHDVVADLNTALVQLATVLKRAYAVRAGGVGLPWLGDIKIQHPIESGYLLNDGRLGTGEDLTATWRDNPAAAACFAALQPLREVEDRVGSHVRRIDRERSIALTAANEKAREESFSGRRPSRAPQTAADAGDWTPPPNAHPFIPPIYRNLPPRKQEFGAMRDPAALEEF